MSELLLCPFCGGEAHMESKHYGDTHYWRVWCQTPFCAFMSVAPTEQQAIEAWNTRAERTCELEFDFGMTAIQCSKCHYRLPKGTHLMEVNYCPNCGAKVMK